MAAVDRISDLPLDLKLSILSFLPIRYILRTSFLSRSWRHVWTHIPQLSYLSARDETCATALRRVDYLLSSLQGPIFHFSLAVNFDGHADESSIFQRFMQTIFEKGDLHVLCLFTWGRPVQFCLPQFNHLGDLFLRTCSVVLPHGFKGFECLTKLCLLDVCVSNNDLQLLIDSSRNLTTAKLFLLPTEPISLTFSSPLLTELQFGFSDLVKSVKVMHAPCLEDVKITGMIWKDYTEESAATMLGFLTTIAGVSALSLDFYAFFHGFDMLPMSPLRVNFHQLKCLRLSGRFLRMDLLYDTFCRLLKSVPVMENLELEISVALPMLIRVSPQQKWYTLSKSESLCDGADQGYIDPILLDKCKKQDGFSCLDRTLKTVRIIAYTFNISICIWMPCFLLLNTNVLKLMEIINCYSCSESQMEMMNELHQIKPVSPDATLLISRTRWEITEQDHTW